MPQCRGNRISICSISPIIGADYLNGILYCLRKETPSVIDKEKLNKTTKLTYMKEKDSADISMEQLILERKRRMKMWNEKIFDKFRVGNYFVTIVFVAAVTVII